MANINLGEYLQGNYEYQIGELYYEQANKNGIEKGEEAIFDRDNNNYHFYPKDCNLLAEWSNTIAQKRSNIYDTLNTKIENGEPYTIAHNKKAFNKCKDKDMLCFYFGNNGKLNGVDRCTLFKYIAARKNGVLYELNFMKFYISKDNRVNCIVKAMQFDRVVDNKGETISDKRVNCCGICYPTSYKGQSKDTLNKLIDDNKNKSFFYNPQVQFNDDAEKILDEFISFINTCDTK